MFGWLARFQALPPRSAETPALRGHLSLALALLCAAGTARGAGEGQELLRGRALYENQCTACHESVVHIRERRVVTSLPALYERVEHWRTVTHAQWSKEEVQAVVDYLNARYYKF